MTQKYNLFEDLKWRGIVKDMTSPLLKDALEKPLTLYCGFDPTSDSLHLGSLLPLLTMRRFQLAGHHPIAVVGGATGMIGDPSGKSQERSLLSEADLKKNLAGITGVISKFLDLKGKNAAKVKNNADWFKMSYIDFLREVGKHFTVNYMMQKESVRARLEDREHGISYTEFSYMLLQSFDYLNLYEKEGCTLQIGGSDQYGNITAGIELIRRMKAIEGDEKVFGLTHPLVTKADGTKFGKTESGNIWLDPKKTSPYQFYQFFIQTADADVIQYLKFFSFRTHEEINQLESSLKSEPEKRAAQVALARELTQMVHGESELIKAEQATQALFGAEIKTLDEDSFLQIFKGAPSTKKPKSSLDLPIVDALVESGLCNSKGNARKDVTAGGIYLNNERISDPAFILKSEHLIAGSFMVLRKGKKNYHVFSFN
jgi:tyrosyl-tRNA synthetase